MKDLMLHVEKIVRPVRATQARKLRMRRELLGHLQTALGEEREHAADKDAALQAAQRRLGEPAELTRGLQQSVPLLERMCLAKLPVPRLLDRWESRRLENPGCQNLNYWGGAMLVGFAFILVWLACFVAAPVSREQFIAFFMMGNENRGRFLAVFMIIWCVSAGALPMFCMVFIESAATETLQTGRVVFRGVVVVCLELVSTLLVITQVMGRVPGILEVVRAIACGSMVLVILFMMARQMARRRQPYREWSSLHISE